MSVQMVLCLSTSKSGNKLEIEYSQQPMEITDLSQPLPVDMVYMQTI
ncbi:hypothetical protein BANRA_04030 [Acinetobacter baumannii]|nr:hypothetical protein BANRA_04030 [Acinetobacter baumannii]